MKTQFTNHREIAEKYITDVNFIVNAVGKEFMSKYGKEEAIKVMTPFMKDRSFTQSVEGLITFFEATKLNTVVIDGDVGTLIFIN